MKLYFDHSWTEFVNGKRLEKQENDLSEVRYFQGPTASTLESKMSSYSFEHQQKCWLLLIVSLITYYFMLSYSISFGFIMLLD